MDSPQADKEILTVDSPLKGKILSVYKTELATERLNIFAAIRNGVFFLAAYLYFIGWIYLYYYLSYFGISLSSLDTPFYFFFVYSYTVIAYNAAWLLPVAIALILCVLVLRSYARKVIADAVILVSLALLFPASFYTARRSAYKQAESVRKESGRNISFILKKKTRDEFDQYAGEPKKSDENADQDEKSDENDNQDDRVNDEYLTAFKIANEAGELRLVFQTNDMFYVLSQPPSEGKKGLSTAYIFIVFKSDVQLATIEVRQ